MGADPRALAAWSGALLATAFPPLEWDALAWVGFIPLLVAVHRHPLRDALKLGFLSGAVFWLFTLHWLTHVTYVGWFILSLYCALYFIPLAGLLSWWITRWGVQDPFKNVALMLCAMATWTGFEYLRAILFTGFGWNVLGVCQYRQVPLIQIARWGGVYLVGSLMIWMNMGLGLTLLRYLENRGHWGRRWHAEFMLALLAFATAHTVGFYTLRAPAPTTDTLRLALIQPNIPQVEKWSEAHIITIYERLFFQTRAALSNRPLDLIVWPETAVPDDIISSATSYDLLYALVTNGVPILLGSMDTEWRDNGRPRYYNSAFLFNPAGHIEGSYDKQHLVLFGEYVPPGAMWLISAMTPIQESFSAGKRSTVFRLPPRHTPFSVLICFEDTIPALARTAVRRGARLLINLTNNAWFDVSSNSRQHMIHCVFRCVENNVPAVRATNTGYTCAIDRHGRIRDVLQAGRQSTGVPGFLVAGVPVAAAPQPLTFYARHGDWWAGACAAASLALLALVAWEQKPARPPDPERDAKSAP